MKWFDVKNQTETSSDLYFYGDIVASDFSKWEKEDTTASDVLDYLTTINEHMKLSIYINSNGGVVTEGMAIYNQLKRHKGQKTIYVDGIAASIASVLAFAGDKLVMPKSSYLMVHLPAVGVFGNKHELTRALNGLETIEKNMMDVYYENLRNESDQEKMKEFVDRETWLTGAQASELFTVELIEGTQAVAYHSPLLEKYHSIPEQLMVEKKEEMDKDSKIKLLNEVELLGL